MHYPLLISIELSFVSMFSYCYNRSISSDYRVFQKFAESVGISESSKNDIGVLSCWKIVQHCLLPCFKTWIWDCVSFVVTSLNQDCWWEILNMSMSIDSITLSMNTDIVFESLWLNQVGLIRERTSWDFDVFCIFTIYWVFQKFAIVIWVGESSNSNVSISSCWILLSHGLSPSSEVRVGYNILFIITTLELDGGWEDLSPSSSNTMNFEIESESIWFSDIGLISQSLAWNSDIPGIGTFNWVSQPMAVLIGVSEMLNSSLSSSSGWLVLQNVLSKGFFTWVCDGISFVVTTTDSNCCWEVLIVVLSVDTMSISIDSQRESKHFWLVVVGLIGHLVSWESDLLGICSFNWVLQEFTIGIWERECSNCDCSWLTCWVVVQNGLSPRALVMVVDSVSFIITSLNLQLRRIILDMTLSVDAVTLCMYSQSEFKGFWFLDIRSIPEGSSWYRNIASIFSVNAILISFAVCICVGEFSDSNIGPASVRAFIDLWSLPGIFLWIGDGIGFVVTTLNQNGRWESCVSVSYRSDKNVEPESIWLFDVGWIREDSSTWIIALPICDLEFWCICSFEVEAHETTVFVSVGEVSKFDHCGFSGWGFILDNCLPRIFT